MTNNVEQLKTTINNESFTKGTYNGIKVIIRDKDGFINATDMCNQFNKRFRKIFENHSWQQYLTTFKSIYYASPEKGGQENEPIYQLNKGISTKYNEYRGSYVDKRLINYIAIWASPEYAVYVGMIMDSINDKVHETLHEEQLADTVENAKPIFNNIVNQIAPNDKTAFEEQFCYGCRDSIKSLDSFEQMDLKKDIDEYKSIKERLNVVEKKLDEWGSFIKQYHPEFEK